MFTQSYHSTLQYAASLAPTLDKPTEFIRWAEDVAQLLTHIYSLDYEEVTVELVEACKELQDYDD